MQDKPIRQKSLAHQVLGILTERIDSGVYPPGSQLPAENALVDELGVSRATIRRALDLLESNGKIIRKHGVGSFVSEATRISNPINEPILFQTLIEISGFQPGVEYISTRVCVPDPDLAHALGLETTDKVVEFQKIFTADKEKVIYLVNTIPLKLLGDNLGNEVLSKPELTEPIFDFLENSCGQMLVYYLCEIRADIMANCPFPETLYDQSEPALVFSEIGHNQDDKPILHSLHYYPGDKMNFGLVRRRIFK